MDNLVVQTDNSEYKICIGTDFDMLEAEVEKLGFRGRTFCIVTDENVSKIYEAEVCQKLEKLGKVFSICFKPGECNKNLDTVQNIYRFFMESKLNRKSVVVALGGGVVGDLAGFCAATYMRGISFIQIPTTLLAQVDSSVGGKVGVDFLMSKNLIGAFYQPKLVYVNVNTLQTLPIREFFAGIAEAVKYGFILDKDFYKYFLDNKYSIKDLDSGQIIYIIRRCCELKAQVVNKDEKESGLREILNFGHTFGHAVETLAGFSLLHGECVAIGMVAALYCSMLIFGEGIDEICINEFKALLDFFELPSYVDCEKHRMTVDDIFAKMLTDKKVKSGDVSLVLVKNIGQAFTYTANSVVPIYDAIRFILS